MPLGRGLSALIPTKKTATDVPVVRGAPPRAGAPHHEDRVWQIPLSHIRPNPYQPRTDFSHEELESLVESVKTHGILQPILVSEDADGGYELISGERRWRAAEFAGLATIPAIVRHVGEQGKLELALVENLQRANLNPVEEAFAYKRLIDEFGLTHEAVSLKVGKSRPAVSNALRLLELPEEIQRALIDGTIERSHAKALLGLKTSGEQLRLFRKIVKEATPTGAVERTVQRVKGRGPVHELSLLEERLRSALQTKVAVQWSRRSRRGKVIIEYYSLDELKALVGKIVRGT